MNVITLLSCITLVTNGANRPAVFHIDDYKFALFKQEEHFQFIPCLAKDTNIVFIDWNRSHVDHVHSWVEKYGDGWKYINEEERLYEWFEWTMADPTRKPLLADSYSPFLESTDNPIQNFHELELATDSGPKSLSG